MPGVDSDAAVAAGGSAEAVRAIAAPGSPQLEGLLKAYSLGVRHVTYLMIAMGVITVLTSFGMGWVDLSKTKPKKLVTVDKTKEVEAGKSEGEKEEV